METQQLDHDKILEVLEALETFLRPELRDIVIGAREGFKGDKYIIELPNPETVDLSLVELAGLVVRTSNHYQQMSILNGIIKGLLKISEGRYKNIYRRSKSGKNEAEREANAMESAHTEYNDYILVDSIGEIVEGLERAARNASESARKIYDKASAAQTAEHRATNHL
jgi:hypothetical protein